MIRRRPAIWIAIAVLSLLGQNLAAAAVSCAVDMPAPDSFSTAMDTDCHATTDHGEEPGTLMNHDCPQSCACPAGPVGVQSSAQVRFGVNDFSPGIRPASRPPWRAGDVHYRPPIGS